MKKRKLKTRKLLLIAFFVVVTGLVILKALLPQRADASWFDESWQYRKKINIASHTASENNVYVTTPTFDATDTSRFKSGCGNIRFTKENGEVLPYFVVACTASASMHVFFDTLPAGESNYYMYYGNVNAANGNSATDFSTAATGLGALALGTETAGPGPIAYWKFDEGTGTAVNDSSSTGLNAALGASTAAPTWATEDQCISGKCLKFDGSNDYVETTNNLGITGTQPRTITFWANAITLTSGTMVSTGTAVANQLFAPIIFTSSWYLNGFSSDRTFTASRSGWHFHAVTYDGATLRWYVDGVQQGAGLAFSPATVDNKVRIGERIDGGFPFNGFIDEVKIYAYARSAAQVLADFNSRGGKQGATTRVRNGTTYLSDGLVGYWKMDEASWTNDCSTASVLDASGNGNNGKACPNATGPTGGAVGKFGNGGSFDGSNDYLDMSTSTSLEPTTITLSAWFKTSSSGTVTTANAILDKARGNAAGSAYLLDVGGRVNANAGKVEFGMFNGSWTTLYSNATVNDGILHHVAVTYDKFNINMYIDGKLDNTVAATVSISYNGTQSFFIGKYNSATDAFFNGQIDEARVYNRALTSSEVRSLYNFAPGPVGYWNFEEGTGTSAKDGSGNANTGTWQGTLGNQWASGKFGNGGNFNGSDDRITMGDPSSLKVSGSITVSAWINGSDFSSIRVIAERFGGTGNSYKLAVLNTGNLYLDVSGTGTGDNYRQTTAVLSTNTWYYVTGVYTSGSSPSIDVYVNGVLSNGSLTGTIPTSLYTGSSAFNIGSDSGVANFFKGQIDDVKIYNYARSPSQILEDMNGSHPVGGSPVGSQIINWKLDEQNGTTVNNSGFGGSTYAGTNSGAAWLTNASCKVNGCLNFDTTTDNMTAGDVAFVDGLTGFSTSFWLNPQTLATNKMIISKANTTTQRVFQIKTDDTTAAKLKVMISSSASDTSNFCVTANSVLTASTWQYITVIYDGTQSTGNDNRVKVYVNGNLATCTVTGTIPTSLVSGTTSNLKLGQGDDSTPTALIAYIDEVKIYNAPLSYDQMLVDYNAGAAQNFGTGTNEATQLTDGAGAAPIGYWNFQEGTGTVKDVSGNGNDGTWNGTGVKHWGAGYYGKAGNFNGSDDFVDMGNITAVNSLAAFSVGVWINSSSYTGGHAIFNKWTASTQDTFDLELSGSNIYVCVANAITDAGNNCVNTTTSLTTGVWYHIEAVYDGSLAAASRAKIYLNGVLQTVTVTGTIPTSLTSSTAPVRIGAFSGTLTRYFSGRIDEVKMYNYARTPAQVAYDFNRARPVAWWKMDECQGGTLNDMSGNNNTGTITIGGTGTQTAVGTCTTASTAWGNGATGKFNSSLNFDGTDDYVTVANSNSLNITSNKMTISAWIKTSDVTLNFQRIVMKDTNVSGTAYGLQFNGTTGKGRFFVGTSSPGIVDTQTALSNNTWTHLVGVYNGTDVRIYVNGVLNNTSANSGNITGNSNSVIIGNTVNLAGTPFKGQIDDVRIYNYDLSATQVQKLYNDDASAFFGPSQGAP